MDFTWELMGNQMDDFMYKLLKMETPPSFERDYDKVIKQYQMFKKQLEKFIKSIS